MEKQMTSQKKIEANQRNALKSTGPKTKLGITHSRANAMTHGLSASAIIIMGENAQDYENLQQSLIDSYNPVDTVEVELVRQMTMAAWRLRRVDMIESYLFRLGNDARTAPSNTENSKKVPSDVIGAGFKNMWKDRHVLSGGFELASLANPIGPEQGGFAVKDEAVDRFHAFSQLGRYQGLAERSFYRALQALEHLQDRRVRRETLVSNQPADRAAQ